MPRLLTVPNFSASDLPDDLNLPEAVTLHYARADPDHGRAVLAFSGDPETVVETLLTLAERLLPAIDLRTATGAHPKIGALDVAPFVDLDGETARDAAEGFARELAARFGIPVRPYELSSSDAASLPHLRKTSGGHPRWGTTVVGARGFLIAANLDFPERLLPEARAAARTLRARRDAGDPALTGVRTLAFHLESRAIAQISFNLTRPDDTGFDAVAAVAEELMPARASATELVGVIRPRDLPGAARLEIEPAQIVT